MKELEFDYYMQIDYSEPVSKCNFTIKCIPEDNMRQRIEDVIIDMYPKSNYSFGADGLKNTQIYGVNEEAHSTFYYHICGKAFTGLHVYDEDEDEALSMVFRHPHGLNCPGEEIKAYYRSIQPELERYEDSYSKAIDIMHRVFRELKYIPNCTNTETSAEEAFQMRAGVCQDYAHIFISLLHLAGITARYVTGLIVGEGASHAWVEILYGGKWYGLDPTNDTQVLTEHIKIGVGRDAKDCMINRGIMHGGGLHTQTIRVNVKEIAGETEDD